MNTSNITILYKIKSGSHLYGLTTPTSDVDYVGVYIEKSFTDFIDPFSGRDEIDLSFKSKLENGKNDVNAIDEKYFHLKKFVRLCADNNPNILEMLFCPQDCIEYVDPAFKLYILEHPEYFVNKKLIDRFIGYAKSQEQKSYTKSANYLLLKKFKDFLEPMITCHYATKISQLITTDEFNKCIDESKYSIITKKHTETNIENYLVLGDMEFSFGLGLKQAWQYLNERFNQISHRVEGIFIHKYESKFMAHTIRLLSEGIQLLKTGRIEFPFTNDEYETIMNIKTGKTPVEQLPNIVNIYKDTLSYFESENNLPSEADYEKIVISYCNIIRVLFAIRY